MKRPRFNNWFPDLLVIVGISLIGYGLSLWRLDVAIVVIGVILLTMGIAMVVNLSSEKPDRDI